MTVALVVRLVGGVVAVGAFLAGLWTVPTRPGRGLALIGFGLFAGVVFGRVPARKTEDQAD